MKTIGLIGGMSWESTVPYYRIINETVHERLGGLHSARILLYSVDFHDIETLQHTGKWDAAGQILAQTARKLQTAGADCLVVCTNTMHKVAAAIEDATSIPLIHIADVTASEIKRHGIAKVGLLGTRFTMEQSFYTDRLRENGIEALVPDSNDREIVHNVIYNELCLGKVLDASRAAFQCVIGRLVDAGADGIVLGCTEISMLIGETDVPMPIFDTTSIHAKAAAEWALTTV